MLLHHPEFAGDFFWRHNVVRFLAPFDHAEPWWFHFPGLLLGMCPWVFLLPAIVRQPLVRFLLLATGWCLLFFSLAGCKRAVYILPALPPLALALGHQLTLVAGPSTRAAWGSTLVLFLALGILGIAGWNQLLPWPLVGVLAGCAVAAMFVVIRDAAHSWPRTAIVTGLVLLLGLQLLMPVYNSQFALRAQLQQHQQSLGGAAMVVLCYPQRWDSISFYAPQAEVKTFLAEEKKELLRAIRAQPGALLLVRSGRWTQLLKQLPPDLEYVGEEKPGAIWAGCVRVRGEMDKPNRGSQFANKAGTPVGNSDISESD
jgi:4-amino-4-deoxy-L-arabinose transferase-like glycosyltransferase